MIRRSARSSSKKYYFLLVLLIPIIGLILLYNFVGSHYLPTQRTTVVFLTDPVSVASFEPTKEEWTEVQFPTNTHISGIQGLGSYAVDSLWNIASTEGSPSAVVLGSITDELGVPVDYYVGTKGHLWQNEHTDDIPALFFNLSGIVKRLSNSFDTNIPLPLFVSLNKSFRSTQSHMIHSINLSKGIGLVEKKLPDNSTILEFDRDQFDQIIDDYFQNTAIRDEHLRVAIFNTTGRPFLGSRAARIVSQAGANIIQVGNEDTPIKECEISGTEEKLQSKTADSAVQLFGCIKKKIAEEGRADLTIRIGTDYEQRFLPKE